MTQLKSLAHPEWPYTGTPHEWRGFVRGNDNPKAVPFKEVAEASRAMIDGLQEFWNGQPARDAEDARIDGLIHDLD